MFLFTVLYYFMVFVMAIIMFIGLYAVIDEFRKAIRRRNAEEI